MFCLNTTSFMKEEIEIYLTILDKAERLHHYNAYKYIPNKQEHIFSHVISMVYR